MSFTRIAKHLLFDFLILVLKALLADGAPGCSSTSDLRSSSSDISHFQPHADSLPAVAAGQFQDVAQAADFTTFASPRPPAQKRVGPYKVYSRLQTMSKVKRYDVSLDELRRRASLPEGFNAAILNNYLRR
jgi:hypothetical protein